MWTRISKCQRGGKETSINRPSNIYSAIDRREVSFTRGGEEPGEEYNFLEKENSNVCEAAIGSSY